jgi:hypothetical protein
MTKYKKYFEKMLEDNKVLFEDFKKLHDEYALKPDSLQETLNKEGEKVLEVIREYERRLCANQERGMYNKFSTNLAEKFQNEVRGHFPMVDHIGLVTQKPQEKPSFEPEFAIKKINL